ncbi:hypothetical protein JCM8547_006686 [Rhodosporidiobolus lusitaniae]
MVVGLTSPPTSSPASRPTSSRLRLKPTLPVLLFLCGHAALFLYYQRSLQEARSTSASFSTRGRSSLFSSFSSSSSSPARPPPPPSAALAASASSLTDPVLPSQSCEVCHLDSTNALCEKYGEDSIRLSRAYEGSGARLRRVLEKALRGESIGVGVLGASITQGHGLADPPSQVWYRKWFDDFQRNFPNAKLHVGAVGAMDSHFFAYCFEALVPSDLDLYILELDVNNIAALSQLRDDDRLMRAILQLPQEPALMRVSAFAILFDELAQGITSNLVTSQFFDIPVIGVRNFLLPHVMHHREAAEELFGFDQWGGRDYRHMSAVSHEALGDMLALYMRKEVCETKRRASLPSFSPTEAAALPAEEDLGKIPPLAIWSSWVHPKPLTPVHPMCQTTVSPLRPLTPFSHSKAFHLLEWNGKSAWGSSQVGAQIRFKFEGTALGVFVWATNGLGADESSEDKKLRRENGPGAAVCWIEEIGLTQEEFAAKFEGKEDADELYSFTVNSHIPTRAASGPEFIDLADNLQYGEHILACEVSAETTSGGNLWRVMGVASQ